MFILLFTKLVIFGKFINLSFSNKDSKKLIKQFQHFFLLFSQSTFMFRPDSPTGIVWDFPISKIGITLILARLYPVRPNWAEEVFYSQDDDAKSINLQQMVETTMDNLPRIYRGIYRGRQIVTAEDLYELPEGLQDRILNLALWVAKMESLPFAGLLRPLLRQIRSISPINSEAPTIVTYDTYSFACKHQPIKTDFGKSYGIDKVENYEHFLAHHEKMQPILKDLVSIVDRIEHEKKLIQVMAELAQYHQELSIIQDLNALIS